MASRLPTVYLFYGDDPFSIAETIQLLRGKDLDLAMQFVNFRD